MKNSQLNFTKKGALYKKCKYKDIIFIYSILILGLVNSKVVTGVYPHFQIFYYDVGAFIYFYYSSIQRFLDNTIFYFFSFTITTYLAREVAPFRKMKNKIVRLILAFRASNRFSSFAIP